MFLSVLHDKKNTPHCLQTINPSLVRADEPERFYLPVTQPFTHIMERLSCGQTGVGCFIKLLPTPVWFVSPALFALQINVAIGTHPVQLQSILWADPGHIANTGRGALLWLPVQQITEPWAACHEGEHQANFSKTTTPPLVFM